jgi:hypothetical protein
MDIGCGSLTYGFGRFGDGRLEKGGSCCTGRWSVSRARASAGLAGAGAARRCGSRGFCGIPL